MPDNELNLLLKKYLDGNPSREEWDRLMSLLASDTINPEPALRSYWESFPLKQDAVKHRSRVRLLRPWYWAAAILVLLSGSGIYYFNNYSYKSKKSQVRQYTQADIPPGSNKAIWTLSDGKQIELDSTVLDMTAKREQSNTGYNELRTPRGGQYQLILPDGSKVWLNAASSIKYPVVFNDKERRVNITGEAYLEIVKDANKPFRVYSDDQQIEVLGTAFNINAYSDEPFKTALAEGSVKVNNQLLRPGQAYINGKIITTNIEQDLAWKNGLFYFNNANITTVMNEISRWYDLDIQYEGKTPATLITGKAPRNINLGTMLKILSLSEIQYKLNGKKLIIKSL